MAAADVVATGDADAASPLRHPAFAALAPWLDDGLDRLSLDRLNDFAAQRVPQPTTDSGAPVRFVAPDAGASAIAYESRILSTGEVGTRAESHHDTFNALCWIAFPQTKRACNALHVRHARATPGGRGALRDALTLFDESGVIALCADAELAALLEARQWKSLFCARRDEAIRALRFFVCGHALYEKLLAPYPGITGRVLVVPVAMSLFESGTATQRAAADGGAAPALEAICSTEEIPPLPLAGIPGWDRRNASAEFYDDTRVFRPLRQ